MNESLDHQPSGEVRHFTTSKIILTGLHAAGIERDKISAFLPRLQEISIRLAEVAPSQIHLTKDKKGENSTLLAQAGRINPYKDTEHSKEQITQWIELELDVAPIPEEVAVELKTLVSDIIDDEVAKHERRKRDEE